ncbi:unnamed protein product [Nippostrongylus brasiliensis]|uniref:Integrase_H2C2 domain-containing protein n=1 Tax=Nippostrongylus brasiliensis TaxID=27835 RepID=A0A0N4YD04_NIPBR|nr:unnamed protein product [Nippostrongylus brasiliensis]
MKRTEKKIAETNPIPLYTDAATRTTTSTEHTLTQLRQWVWIPKARATIKRVINNRCFICKRLNAKPFKLPDFPIHPDFRVNKPSYP